MEGWYELVKTRKELRQLNIFWVRQGGSVKAEFQGHW